MTKPGLTARARTRTGHGGSAMKCAAVARSASRSFAAAARDGARRRPGTADPQRRRAGLAQRHRHRRRGQVRHRSERGRIRGLRGRRQAEADVLLADAAADLAGAPARHQREHGRAHGRSRRKRRSASPGSCTRTTRPKSSTSTARSASSQAFTNDAAALEKAIRATTPNGSTSLYNAIYISLKELKKVKAHAPTDIRRQAIVLLSDGDDTSSLIEFDEVLDLAKRSETAIYCDRPARRERSARREFKEAEFVLQAARERNRRPGLLPQPTRASCRRSTRRSGTSCRASTRIAYSSANPKRDGAWRRIQVRLARPGTTARTKQGYYGPTGS